MKRYFKIAVLTFLAVGLMGGSAFAAASLNGGNASVASELVSSAAAYNLPATAANTAYQPAGAVAVSTQVKISLAGGSFSTLAYVAGATGMNICQGTTTMANGMATTAADSSVVITLGKPLASGTVYTIQADDCAVANTAIGSQIRINAGATGGSTVIMTVDNNLLASDSNLLASATIATVTDQFSATLLSTATDTIDFTASPTMTLFKSGGSGATTATSTAKIAILSNETIGTKVASGHAGSNTTCGAWPAGTEALTLTVTPGSGTTMGTGFHATTPFQNVAYKAGVASPVYTVDASIKSTDANGTGSPTLTANLAAATCGASTTAATIATNSIYQNLLVDSATALTARSYKLAVATKSATGAIVTGRTLIAATTAWTWGLDATQFYVPLIKSSTGTETYIKIQSKSSLAGSNGLAVQVLCSDGSMTTVTPSPASVTSGVPTTISGADIITLLTAAGKSVDGVKGFAAIVTVNTPNQDVFGYANIANAAGEKRIPMQRLNTATLAGVPTTVAE